MPATVTELATDTTTTGAASHTSATFSPSAGSWILVFFQSWLTAAGTIAHDVSDSVGLSWSSGSNRGGQSAVTTAFGGRESRCTVWTAYVPGPILSMDVTMESHASVAAEAGWQIVEISGDVHPTWPLIECLVSIVGNAGTNALGGISETTDTLSVAPSGKVIAGFGFEHNWNAPGTTWNTPPTDWSVVAGTTVDGTDQWWLQELLETDTVKTSATHGATGDTTVQNRGMYIAEIDAPPAAGSGVPLPRLSTSRKHLLTR